MVFMGQVNVECCGGGLQQMRNDKLLRLPASEVELNGCHYKFSIVQPQDDIRSATCVPAWHVRTLGKKEDRDKATMVAQAEHCRRQHIRAAPRRSRVSVYRS